MWRKERWFRRVMPTASVEIAHPRGHKANLMPRHVFALVRPGTVLAGAGSDQGIITIGASGEIEFIQGKSTAMTVLFLQTAEATYRPLLEASSRTIVEYCARHDFCCDTFFGIARGYYPWQATYNRIPLLKRLLDGGYTGWVCYLDADAFVADLDFDLRAYLGDKERVALIIAPAEPDAPWWNVNAGVFLINLGHPIGQRIVKGWSSRFDEVTDQQLSAAMRWSQTKDDQMLLAETLQSIPEAERATLLQRGDTSLLNYTQGRFIKQILRVIGDLEKRASYLRVQADNVLGQEVPVSDPQFKRQDLEANEAFIRAVYRVLLLREPDRGGLADGLTFLQMGMSYEDLLRRVLACKEFAFKRWQFIDAYMQDKLRVVNMTELANKYGSDKGTVCGSPPHRYTYLYDLILDRYRHLSADFLELGLAVGGPEIGGPVDREVDSPSVKMWLEYFPHAHVYGFDISDFSQIKHPRFTFVRGDGGSSVDLQRLANAASGFDVIIDDGSHASYHQQLAFKHLFPKLRPGGTYIIEDLHWQSPIYEGKPIPLPRTRDFMVGLFEKDEYIPNEVLSEDFMRAVKSATASYAWFPPFNGGESTAKLFVLRKAA